MVILGAAVAVVGVLCLLDLLLTFGVIRRLREHTELLSRAGGVDMPVVGLAAGELVAAFSVPALGGGVLTGPDGLRAAGFFSSMCSVCPERVGPFTEYLASHGVPPEGVLSVVVTPEDDPPPYAGRLREAGRVCVVRDDSEVVKAFKVAGFPAFCVLDAAGGLVAASYDPSRLPAPGAAA